MNRFINISGLAVITIALMVSGCEKQLITHPQQSLDPSIAFSTREGIDASITGIYARLKNVRQYGKDLIAIPEALADNGYATNKSGRLLNEANNVSPVPSTGANHFTTTIWTNSYAAINQVNLTLEAIPSLTGTSITQADRDRWNGQLYFLRGLFYFDLSRVYAYIPGAVVASQDKGGVILSTKGVASATGALSFNPPRSSIDSCYLLIVDDLTKANTLLLNPGLGANLANKLAAQALLAKVNLYRKNYAEAKRWADSCIAGGASKLTNTGNYVAQWRAATNQEILFQVAFLTSAENIGVNESLQTSFTTLVTPGNTAQTGGFGDLVPTLTLLTDLGITLTGGNTTTAFAANASIATRSTDVRNLMYEPGTTGRGPSKVECTKYIGKNGAINLDNVPVIRISEAILIRAEALGTPGSSVYNAAAALTDLKNIKSNRYTGYTGSALETADNALTGQGLLDEILRQRRIELAFEGNRFFDLKRLGLDLVKGPHYNNVAFTDTRILPPIPPGDISINPNLKQNQGY